MNLVPGITLVLVGSALEGLAQVCLKQAASYTALKYVSWVSLGALLFLFEIALSPRALKSLDIAIAYPLSALSYASVVIAARVLLKEYPTPQRWLGVAFIVAGAALAIPE